MIDLFSTTIDFIRKGPLPQEVKNLLVNGDELQNWDDGWLGYVYIFKPAYPDVSDEQFMLLNTV